MTIEQIFRLLISSPVVAAFVVGVFSIFTVYLPLRRYHHQKWWDRRADTYGSLLNALHHLMEQNSSLAKESMREGGLSEERSIELRQASQKSEQEIARLGHMGGFLISDRAEQILAALRRDIKEAWSTAKIEGDYIGGLLKESEIMSQRLYELKREAARHLQIDA